jgi:hypothetical protein
VMGLIFKAFFYEKLTLQKGDDLTLSSLFPHLHFAIFLLSCQRFIASLTVLTLFRSPPGNRGAIYP